MYPMSANKFSLENRKKLIEWAKASTEMGPPINCEIQQQRSNWSPT